MDVNYSPQGQGQPTPQVPPQPQPTPQAPQAAPMPPQQGQVPPQPQGQPPVQGGGYMPFDHQQQAQTTDGYKDHGWSWGAAMLNFFFLLGIRRHALAAALILLPIVLMFGGVFLTLFVMSHSPAAAVFLALFPILWLGYWLGTFIFLGVKGRAMARSSRTFSNESEYLGFMKGVDHAGKIMFYIILIYFAAAILFGVIGGVMGTRDRVEIDERIYVESPEFYEIQEQQQMQFEGDYYNY